VMHEHGKQKNDRQRDSDQPKQSTLSERHVSLHSMIVGMATPKGFRWFHPVSRDF
jgi:hypothetical protein